MDKSLISMLQVQSLALKKKIEIIELGGGQKKIDQQHAQKKLTARERITFLIDQDTVFLEIGALVGSDMYTEHGGCPAGGIIVGIGYVKKRMCVIVANDATIKAGAWFPITTKKYLRAQEIALKNRLPIIYLVDSAGIYLPLQDEVFPDQVHFGRIFYNNAKMSSKGIIQIAAIMGHCVAGGAYLPIMSDETLIVDKTGTILLAGSYLVKTAIGEKVDNETLGGATTHCEISGITDNKFKDDEACLVAIQRLVARIGLPKNAGYCRVIPKPPCNPEALYTILPDSRATPYDTLHIIQSLVDQNTFEEYKPCFGKTLLCGYAYIDGWSVGIIANQRKMVKKKSGEMQIGGVIYADAAVKAARFIMNCNQRKIPMVFLQDVSGFMIGKQAEHSGIIKEGAKMISAVANSIVPKFTVIIGNAYGAGYYAMCGKAYDPNFIVAWPSAQIAVMSGHSAANTLLQMKINQRKKVGKAITDQEKHTWHTDIIDQYKKKTDPYYAAARLWVDAVIDPLATRTWISQGIAAANHAPITQSFNVGIMQT